MRGHRTAGDVMELLDALERWTEKHTTAHRSFYTDEENEIRAFVTPRTQPPPM